MVLSLIVRIFNGKIHQKNLVFYVDFTTREKLLNHNLLNILF